MSAYMCANSPPDSTMPWLMPAKRTHLACLNCRRRKIKCFSADETKPCARCAAKSLICEYMAVSEKQAKSLPNSRATRICLGCPSALNADSEAVHAPIPSKMHSIDEGERTNPTPMDHGNRLPRQPQLPASGSRDLYNYEGKQPPLPLSPPPQFAASHGERRGGRSHTAHGPSHASSGFPSQQPGPSDYDRYFANFGLPPSYDPEIYPVQVMCWIVGLGMPLDTIRPKITQKYILFNLTAKVPEIPEIPETPDSFPYAKLRIAERMLYTETHNTTALNQSYVL
ncbi:hypothetical protein DFH09DRAFT_1335941 [Mycena vulgaris]|nr:hypothetical protein DFH09DRAFT_1335941 [Mycena vulgaris]